MILFVNVSHSGSWHVVIPLFLKICWAWSVICGIVCTTKEITSQQYHRALGKNSDKRTENKFLWRRALLKNVSLELLFQLYSSVVIYTDFFFFFLPLNTQTPTQGPCGKETLVITGLDVFSLSSGVLNTHLNYTS